MYIHYTTTSDETIAQAICWNTWFSIEQTCALLNVYVCFLYSKILCEVKIRQLKIATQNNSLSHFFPTFICLTVCCLRKVLENMSKIAVFNSNLINRNILLWIDFKYVQNTHSFQFIHSIKWYWQWQWISRKIFTQQWHKKTIWKMAIKFISTNRVHMEKMSQHQYWCMDQFLWMLHQFHNNSIACQMNWQSLLCQRH